MKTPNSRIMLAALCLTAAIPAHAQAPPGYPPSSVASAPLLAPDQLQDLVGRVALYPDDLLALILPASTTPLDIVKAQRFLTKYAADKSLKPDPSLSRPVMNLLTYPDVINLMSDDLDWTESLGLAVTAQQADVLDAIQVIRRKAQAAGNLHSDDKQLVVVKQETVQIVPAKPEVIYVPVYQPATVIVAQPEPAVTYVSAAYPLYYNPVATAAVAATAGYIVGASTAYGVNWYGGGCYHAPCASYANHIQEERMDYANHAREDWQDYGKSSREDWQKYSSNQQSQRQDAAASNQAARQQTSTTSQSQRQQAAAGAQDQRGSNQAQRQDAAATGLDQRSANQTQRQNTATGAQASSQQSQAARQSSIQQNQASRQATMPQGAQSWQRPEANSSSPVSGHATAGNRAGDYSGQRQGAASSSQFGTRQPSHSSSGAFGGASSGSRAQSYSERGARSMSGGARSGGGRRR